MARCCWPLALLGVVLFTPIPGSAAPAPSTLVIQADLVQFDPNLEQTQARGDARLSYAGLELQADLITANRLSGEVGASGGLALTQSGRRLTGDDLAYNVRTEEGVLTQARVVEQGVVIRGDRIEFSPGSLTAHRASFTTCDRPHPHYSLGAERISLTAQPAQQAEPTQTGRLTLENARVTYHDRRLFTIPRYSVTVGQLQEPAASPLPVTGFSRDDGPYASISYVLDTEDESSVAALNYRYTTLRGIRGYLRFRQRLGDAELTAGYTRREDPSDRELRPDEIEASLANVLVNRTPEYGLRLPDLSIGGPLRMRAEWITGSYSERLPSEEEARARGDRTSASVLVSTKTYRVSPQMTLSHAIGWRHSTYSSGGDLKIGLYRHTLTFLPRPGLHLALSYVTRRGEGDSPFLFDQISARRELLTDLRWSLGPRWRFRVVEAFDLGNREGRDTIISVSRTVHCLDYTVGWRQRRGAIFIGIGLATPHAEDTQS
jgi:lipopolysaccharide export system protein LptA